MKPLAWKLSLWSFVFVILFFAIGLFVGPTLPEVGGLMPEPETGCFHFVAFASYYKCNSVLGGETIAWALNQARFPAPLFFLPNKLHNLASVFTHPEWLLYASFWRELGLAIAYILAFLFPVLCLSRLLGFLRH